MGREAQVKVTLLAVVELRAHVIGMLGSALGAPSA